MGGCASKPKDFDDLKLKPLPKDANVTSKNIDTTYANPPAEEVKNEGDGDNEAPLVDVSKTKQEVIEVASEPKTMDVVETAAAAAATTPVVIQEEDIAPIVIKGEEKENEPVAREIEVANEPEANKMKVENKHEAKEIKVEEAEAKETNVANETEPKETKVENEAVANEAKVDKQYVGESA